MSIANAFSCVTQPVSFSRLRITMGNSSTCLREHGGFSIAHIYFNQIVIVGSAEFKASSSFHLIAYWNLALSFTACVLRCYPYHSTSYNNAILVSEQANCVPHFMFFYLVPSRLDDFQSPEASSDLELFEMRDIATIYDKECCHI